MTSTAPTTRRGAGQWTLTALVIAIGCLLVIGGFRLPLPLNVGYLGPQWFPIGIGAVLILLGCLLPLQRERTEEPEPTDDWRAFGIVVATLAAHVLLLSLVGWIPAGIVLFWGVARALGGRRGLFDLGVAAVFSCTVQFAFSAGLGIALPVGALLEVG
ncbi:tripartite tricarboxylate transporter TctB family protein [Saccharopolyspora hirsuta]|uniref:Tripartite tricarboxylate transporter TctB family protein n=1 Tax=Saccharopolyspora hirsuta TaxID=1837 RepID=A0A5M7C434_SACHI|nr:tripartite tricarboxylate transporter TctB family protein [Saccharopolyspora hirsuta]KAA5835237.1 tripartite tricarboxylate transporter TctB family protein [Saccharopolyspora hirsuta]